MGGAERAERKRKQRAVQVAGTAPVATAGAGRGPGRGVLPSVLITVLLVLVVGAGVWLQNRNEPGDLPAAIPPAAAGPQYPVAVKGDAVLIGSADAPVTIDVYEDFLCPACGQFEQLYGEQLDEAVAAEQARVIYHPVAILDAYSTPAGYSTLAAGAALCAADAEVFPRYHHSLFDSQPREGGPSWTSAQLQRLGRDLGAGDDFVRCVQDADGSRITDATDSARERLSRLRPDNRFGTPTILVNNTVVDAGDEGWLDEALGAAR